MRENTYPTQKKKKNYMNCLLRNWTNLKQGEGD